VQTAPPLPHSKSSIPVWHTPFAQQPLQLLELHDAVLLHVPLMQLSPLWHTVQAPPFFPHADVRLPPWQVLFWQQPTQLVGPHVDEQACDTHLSVPEQALHAAPPLPQAEVRVPAWQVSPWQQPLEHEELVQVHLPDTQVWFVEQAMHAPPPLPHATLVVLVMHFPPASQHPLAQLLGPQVWGRSLHVPL
jgi:hypothetical protein